MQFKLIHILNEQYDNLEQYLIESGFTINDLRKKIPSKRNLHFLKVRQTEGNSGSFLTDVIWNDKKDTLLLDYKVVPTGDEKIVKIVNLNGKVEDATEYNVKIEFQEVSKYLKSKQEFLSLSKMDQVNQIINIIKKCKVKVHANDASYYWQGVWDVADKQGFAIEKFPKNNNRGKGIWSKRHTGKYPGKYLTKHILECLNNTMFLSSIIAKKIRTKYE